MFVAHAIFPVSINSYGSRTSNSCIFPAFNIAFSSVRLISVQFSSGVVDVFLFGQCTLIAGFVMPASCRKALVVYSVHAFFTGTWRHVWFVAAPTNRASTIIVKMVKILTTTNFLWREPCNISLREYSTERTSQDLEQRQNTWVQSWLLAFKQVFLHHARETLGMGSYYPMRPRNTPLISNIKRPPFCNLAAKVGFLRKKARSLFFRDVVRSVTSVHYYGRVYNRYRLWVEVYWLSISGRQGKLISVALLCTGESNSFDIVGLILVDKTLCCQ